MKKVVIIEDNQLTLQILKCWFMDEEFQMMCINKVENLSQRISLFKPDLIITDIKLIATPTKKLLRVFRRVKFPVVVISSMKKDEVDYFTKRIGALASFTKPLNLIEIFGCIQDFFNEKDRTMKTLQL